MKLKPYIFLLFFVVAMILPAVASAHCPLCTVGAAAAGGIAAWLGVSGFVIGLFIGAASLSLGWWFARQIKKKIVPCQTSLVTLLVYLSVVLPVYPLVPDYTSVYLAWFGDYGTVFHNTYLVNLFLLGSVLGAVVVLVAPTLSRYLTNLKGKKPIPFQGLAITLVALILISLLVEFIL